MLSTGFEGIDDWQRGAWHGARWFSTEQISIWERLDDTQEGLMSRSDIEHKLRTDLVTRV